MNIYQQKNNINIKIDSIIIISTVKHLNFRNIISIYFCYLHTYLHNIMTSGLSATIIRYYILIKSHCE